MGLEGSVSKIEDLNSSWPLSSDERSQGDDHFRNLKVALKSLLTNLDQILGEKANDNPTNHDRYDEKLKTALEINKTAPANENTTVDFYSATGGVKSAYLARQSGTNGELQVVQSGTGVFSFYMAGTRRFRILSVGGVEDIWDDTPTDGQDKKGVTSDWAFNHKGNAAAHHAKYLDTEAVTAMGAKADDNPLNHDKPTVFVDRGDPSSMDWSLGSFTFDASWYDLDLSSIVPAGTKSVLFRARLIDDVAHTSVYFRKNGNTNISNVSVIRQNVANHECDEDLIVACDSNRVVEYMSPNSPTSFWLIVRGWWI